MPEGEMPEGEKPELGEMPEGEMPEGEKPELGEMPEGEQPQSGDTSDEDMSTVETPWIHISGGTLTILNDSGRDADGIDSNGDIIITGGTIRVSLTGDGGNNAIDCATENGGVCEISGGSIIACGSSQMAEGFGSSSTQCSVLYNLQTGAEAGTTLTLRDSDGNVLMSYEVPNAFTSVNISCPEMELGETYTISVGETEETVTLEEITTTSGAAGGSMFGGMNQGGMQNGSYGRKGQGGPGGKRFSQENTAQESTSQETVSQDGALQDN